jgi:hypothetical protein
VRESRDAVIHAVPARVITPIPPSPQQDDEREEVGRTVEQALRHLTGLRFALERLQRQINGRGSPTPPPAQTDEE